MLTILGSTSAVLNQVVLETTSSATLTSSPNPSTQGQAVTFTATISSPTVIPTGPVTFTPGRPCSGQRQLSGGKGKADDLVTARWLDQGHGDVLRETRTSPRVQLRSRRQCGKDAVTLLSRRAFHTAQESLWHSATKLGCNAPCPYQGEAKVEVNTSITGVVFVQCAPQLLSANFFQRLLAWSVGFWLCAGMSALAQQLPYINTGSDSAFSRMDMAQTYLDTMSRDMQSSAQQQARNKVLIDSGLVSALDLAAPHKAVEEFNRANSLLRAQNSKEAMKHLHKAIADYPRFVSAHVSLGLACVDQEETVCAKSEFEAAAKLDDKFAGSFLHLGQLALSLNDFGTAQTVLEKAASLSPTDAKILSRLAYAQHGAHEFRHALETVHRIHALDHKGLANVHYVAASAALALNDFDTMERELGFFIGEDPTNAFAPVARQNLDALTRNQAVRSAAAGSPEHATTIVASLPSHTFPNTERLKAELTALGDEFDDENCDECDTLAEANTSTVPGNSSAVSDVPIGRPARVGAWTIRTSVDQVTLFFTVSRHGQMVNDLEASNIQIFDDNKPPEKIVQFAPQSKLPLRLALLVDTSGSVHDRFSFEKRAATKFVEKMLSGSSDLGFIAGFADEVTVDSGFQFGIRGPGKGD